MDTSLEWNLVIGERKFTSGHRTVGGEEEEPSDGLHEKQKHGRRYGAIRKLRHTNFMIFLPLPHPCHMWPDF